MKTVLYSNIHDIKKIQLLLVSKRWVWHVLFWTGYISTRIWSYYITVRYYDRRFLYFMLCYELLFAGFTYAVIFFYSKTFFRRKFFTFIAGGILLSVVYLIIRIKVQFFFLEKIPEFKETTMSDLFLSGISTTLIYFLLVTLCKYFKDSFISQYYENEMKQQQMKAELESLKAQIAPHFLFNTMNNFYGLAVEKSDKLPGLMLRLSDMLRHSLYETQKPFVPLAAEIEALRSYTELEKIRLEDNLDITFTENIDTTEGYVIAPLLLLVFVENAFKHAKRTQKEETWITIAIKKERSKLVFECSNAYDPGQNGHSKTTMGIGLQNVKRRLQAIYPGEMHDLHSSTYQSSYYISLHLTLNTSPYA
jgi:two-component system, LytTR family, sensor histidine kinase LytS